MKKITLTLQGQPATKKNSAMLIKGQARILPSAAYLKYEAACRKLLRPHRDAGELYHFTMPVRMTCKYYLKDRAHWPDLTGLMQATADILSDTKDRVDKKCNKVIKGEKWMLSDDRIICSWDGSKIAGIDPYDPRVEIEIAELEIDMESAHDPYVRKQLRELETQTLF